jgi:hypothetical protein
MKRSPPRHILSLSKRLVLVWEPRVVILSGERISIWHPVLWMWRQGSGLPTCYGFSATCNRNTEHRIVVKRQLITHECRKRLYWPRAVVWVSDDVMGEGDSEELVAYSHSGGMICTIPRDWLHRCGDLKSLCNRLLLIPAFWVRSPPASFANTTTASHRASFLCTFLPRPFQIQTQLHMVRCAAQHTFLGNQTRADATLRCRADSSIMASSSPSVSRPGIHSHPCSIPFQAATVSPSTTDANSLDRKRVRHVTGPLLLPRVLILTSSGKSVAYRSEFLDNPAILVIPRPCV